MNKKEFDKIKEDLAEIIRKSPIAWDLKHAELVLHWLLVLKPDSDLELQTAAFGHDMERGITGITNKDLKDMNNYEKDRSEHAERSTKYMIELLEKHKCQKTEIEKISRIVKNHELGGDEEIDALRDADSIAWFDDAAPNYLKRNGLEKTKFKVNYMFDRISNQKAKEIILNLEYNDPEIRKLVDESR